MVFPDRHAIDSDGLSRLISYIVALNSSIRGGRQTATLQRQSSDRRALIPAQALFQRDLARQSRGLQGQFHGSQRSQDFALRFRGVRDSIRRFTVSCVYGAELHRERQRHLSRLDLSKPRTASLR